MTKVAWTGELEFLGASEDDLAGRRVKFRVIQTPADQGAANPFKRWKKGKKGTRFRAGLTVVGFEVPDYADEVILSAWSDSEVGWTVTFTLTAEGDRHPFMGFSRPTKERIGTRVMCALAEVDDDEQIVDQEQKGRVEIAEAQRKGQRLSAVFYTLVRSLKYREFLRETVLAKEWSEEDAIVHAKSLIGITSARELDENPLMADRFHKNVRAPFVSATSYSWEPSI